MERPINYPTEDRRKINYPERVGQDFLAPIFELQEQLVRKYTQIERTPQPPISLHDKANQKLMKDFIRRGIEELAEAYEVMEKLFLACEKAERDLEEIVNLVIDLNEELADALHFFVEAMIYCNIGSDDINQWYATYNRKNQINYTIRNPLQTAVEVSRVLLDREGYDLSDNGFITIDNSGVKEIFFNKCAGRRISKSKLKEQAQLLWETTYYYNLATNLLKKNSWRQGEVEVDVNDFQQAMMLAWVCLINVFVHAGLNAEGILIAYQHKNIINFKRLEEKR